MSDTPIMATPAPMLHGLLAEFDNVDDLTAACRAVREGGYTRWDAHTPFPVHGLDAAMGVRPTRLPWLVLLSGSTGLGAALLMQWFMNTFDYPFRISGKPLFSLPAFVPVTFEFTVLFSAFAVFFGSLALNLLPEHYSPLDTCARFRRATADRFFVYVQSRDPAFDPAGLQALFGRCHAHAVEQVFHDAFGPGARLPKGLIGITAVFTAFTLVPLALIARARESTSELPRIHIIPDDMDSQYKHKAQAPNWFFSDNSAMRPPPEGTVAAEDRRSDTAFYTGKQDGAYIARLGGMVATDEQTMHRGRERFGVYCMPCHGLSGRGDGMVARHADRLQEGTWVTPSSLHDARVRALADGDIFNTITHGVRNMPGYGAQIEPRDRWAIIMYVRALQLSQHAPKTDVPADNLPALQ